MEVLELRRGPVDEDNLRPPLRLTISPNAFAVKFRKGVSGARSARRALAMPFRLGRSMHARLGAYPSGLAVFEVAPDQGGQQLPGLRDPVAEFRDTAMSVIRSNLQSADSIVEYCYHTYRAEDAEDGAVESELIPSGSLYLEFHASFPENRQAELFEHYGLLVDREVKYYAGAFVVSLTQSSGTNPIKLAQELLDQTFSLKRKGGKKTDCHVFDHAEPLFHRYRTTHVIPRSPAFPYQWYLRNDGLSGGTAGIDIGAPQAWDRTTGRADVKVAVIDDAFDIEACGIQADRVDAPLNLHDKSSDVSPSRGRDEWHGTSVLGLIGAPHVGSGICGLAPDCGMIPIKLEPLVDDDAEARAFDHAVARGAAVINCSWGPYDGWSSKRWPMPRLTELAIENAYLNRVAVVFAAGNGAENLDLDGYANHPCTIAVSATTDRDDRAEYSDYGERVWVCAPSSGGGSDVVSTDVAAGGYNPLGDVTQDFGGTSAAAPLVAGTIALMQSAFLAEDPSRDPVKDRLSVAEVRAILRDSASPVRAEDTTFTDYWNRSPVSTAMRDDGHSLAFGYGRLNTAACVRQAQRWQRDAVAKNFLQDLDKQAAKVRREPDVRQRVSVGPRGTEKVDYELPERVVGDPLSIFHAGREQMEGPSKQRFNAGEHVWLGSEGFRLACLEAGLDYEREYNTIARNTPPSSERFSYGEIVALSGDFYASPEDLFFEKPTWLPWGANDVKDLKKLMAKEVKALLKQMSGASVKYPDFNVRFWWNAKNFTELAKDNTDHFGWHNMVRYCHVHRWAIDLALRARVASSEEEKDILTRRAFYWNGFADHFLTDAFAAGHIRVPRQEIRDWASEVGLNETKAGFLSKLLHDQDGHLETRHGADSEFSRPLSDGLHVTNAGGVEWHTRCDGQLFIGSDGSQAVIAQPVEAVKKSVLEVIRALQEGEAPEGVYQASEQVPFPHPDCQLLCEKFRPDDMASIRKWVKHAKWYEFGLNESNLVDLFTALPILMARFRKAVTHAAKDEGLQERLAPAYVAAFSNLDGE